VLEHPATNGEVPVIFRQSDTAI